MKILTPSEMREVDRLTTERYRVPSLTLMENAGKSVAEFIQSRFPQLKSRAVTVLCGKGNNGGDGFVVARQLRKMGANVRVRLIGDAASVKGDAAKNLKRWKNSGGKIAAQSSSDLNSLGLSDDEIIVDALLGTGTRGPVQGELRSVIDSVNRHGSGCTVISVDIPSGLNADSGEVGNVAIKADYTVTFTAPKPGLFLGGGPQHMGELLVREIGSPRELIEQTGKGTLRWSDAGEFAKFATRRKPEGHKGDYGHALIVAGSVGKTGAAVLASWAALRVGAGLVTVATPEPALPMVAAHTPEVMTEPLAATKAGTVSERSLEGKLFETLLKGKRALGMGPGLSTQDETQSFIRNLVRRRSNVPIVLDADGLNAFAGRAREMSDPKGLLAVTPHPGEMSRLLSLTTAEVQERRVELAQRAAAEWNAIVVLKGHHTVVAAPGGPTFINSTGNPGMGTGGTGDVLTGMLAGLTAQYGTDSWPEVLAFGVYLHGLAGDIAYAENGEAPLMASDLIRSLPRAYQRFYAECGRE